LVFFVFHCRDAISFPASLAQSRKFHGPTPCSRLQLFIARIALAVTVMKALKE
jgi:hypothetical protein